MNGNFSGIRVAVDILFLTVQGRRLKLLLSRRREPPAEGQWALPGCFIGAEESAEEAVRRLTDEMLPGAKAYYEQLYTFSRADRDARGRVISIAYVAIVPRSRLEGLLPASMMTRFEAQVCDGRLSLRAEEGEKPDPLAFDHGEIVSTGIRRLQGKIGYTDIGLRFLNDPHSFTMAELEGVFEAISGEKADKSNFRRFIRSRFEENGKIVPTGQYVRQNRGRPAMLYDWTEREA